MLKDHLRSAFREDRFWAWAWLVFGSIAVLKGLRLPSRWGATEAIIGYDQGFIKRGLFGATFGKWFDLRHYDHFVVAAYAIFFLFLALLVIGLYRSGVLKTARGQLVATVFGACFGLTYIAHIVGYLDILLALLELLLLLVPTPKLRALAAWPIAIVAVLIHEQFVLAFLPLVLFQLWLDMPEGSPTRARALKLVPLLAAVVILVAATSLRVPFNDAQSASFQQALGRTADFPLREDCFVVLQRTGLQNVLGTIHDLMGMHGILKLFGGGLIMLPAAVFICLMTRRTLAEHGRDKFTIVAALFASFSPFLLSVAGWDFPRWDALVCLQSFLVFMVIQRNRASIDAPVGERTRNLAIFLIAIGMATGKPLMDRAEIDSFPQYHLARDLARSLHTHHLEPPDK
jgi:hypothetical protein